MNYHRFRFGWLPSLADLLQRPEKSLGKKIGHWFVAWKRSNNWQALGCRLFGHRLNGDPARHWCGRCGMAYEEVYYPEDYWTEAGILKKAQ